MVLVCCVWLVVGCGLQRPKEERKGCGHYGQDCNLQRGAEPIAQLCAGVGVLFRAHGAEFGGGVGVFVHGVGGCDYG